MMKLNKWTAVLATTGVVSLASIVQAAEHPVNTLLSSTTLYGYVDVSANWNTGRGHGTASRFYNTGSDRLDGFNVDAIKVALEKPLDEGTWSAGYKVEAVAGGLSDASGSVFSDHLKQAYVALRAPIGNGIDFKIGKFDPIIGYEVVDSYANPNYSRSFGFAIEPLTHTGILATYQFSDIFGVAAGVGNSDDSTTASSTGRESNKTFMAGITVKAPDSFGWLTGSSLYAGIVDSAHKSGNPDTVNLYIGVSVPTPIQGLTAGFAYDHMAMASGGIGEGYVGGSYANAFALYLSYQLTEQVKLNGRVEYANSGYGAFTGYGRDKVFGLTGTIDYALFANVVTRAEIRWDKAVGAHTLADGQKNDLNLTANVIYKF